MQHPSFWSLAFDEITDPDYAHVAVGVLPAHATADPAAWARNLMTVDALPRWLALLLGARLLLNRWVGRPAWCTALRVRRVEGDEALVSVDSRHLDMRVGVGVDEEHALVRVVTAVRFKGPRALALSWPARAALPFVMHRMIARSRRALSGVTAG